MIITQELSTSEWNPFIHKLYGKPEIPKDLLDPYNYYKQAGHALVIASYDGCMIDYLEGFGCISPGDGEYAIINHFYTNMQEYMHTLVYHLMKLSNSMGYKGLRICSPVHDKLFQSIPEFEYNAQDGYYQYTKQPLKLTGTKWGLSPTCKDWSRKLKLKKDGHFILNADSQINNNCCTGTYQCEEDNMIIFNLTKINNNAVDKTFQCNYQIIEEDYSTNILDKYYIEGNVRLKLSLNIFNEFIGLSDPENLMLYYDSHRDYEPKTVYWSKLWIILNIDTSTPISGGRDVLSGTKWGDYPSSHGFGREVQFNADGTCVIEETIEQWSINWVKFSGNYRVEGDTIVLENFVEVNSFNKPIECSQKVTIPFEFQEGDYEEKSYDYLIKGTRKLLLKQHIFAAITDLVDDDESEFEEELSLY